MSCRPRADAEVPLEARALLAEVGERPRDDTRAWSWPTGKRYDLWLLSYLPTGVKPAGTAGPAPPW